MCISIEMRELSFIFQHFLFWNLKWYFELNLGAERTRTAYLDNANVALYQVSYDPRHVDYSEARLHSKHEYIFNLRILANIFNVNYMQN